MSWSIPTLIEADIKNGKAQSHVSNRQRRAIYFAGAAK